MDRHRLPAVAVGAVIGATVRWAALAAAGPGGAAAALLVVNVVGSALAGAVLAGPAIGRLTPGRARDVLVAGFCGALTSWSSLAVQLARDTSAGAWGTAAAWLGAHLVLGIGAAVVAFRATAPRAPTGRARGATP